MAVNSSTLLKRLERLKTSFGGVTAPRKIDLLERLERRRLSTADQLLRFHELLCFQRAYPDNAAQLEVVERLLTLLRRGADQGCELIVFPELALTTFFPRWALDDGGDGEISGDTTELDSYYETEMPNAAIQPLFDEAKRRGVGFHIGYAELTDPDDPSGLRDEPPRDGHYDPANDIWTVTANRCGLDTSDAVWTGALVLDARSPLHRGCNHTAARR